MTVRFMKEINDRTKKEDLTKRTDEENKEEDKSKCMTKMRKGIMTRSIIKNKNNPKIHCKNIKEMHGRLEKTSTLKKC